MVDPAGPAELPVVSTVGARVALARRNVARSFGYRVLPFVVSLGYRLVRGLGSACMALDPLFFPRLRKVEAKAPIVLVGNPRSGTTFLQRWLHSHDVGTGLELYRLIYPSLLQQAVIRPLLPLIKPFDPTRFHATSAHKTSLDAVETDDAAFLARLADGFLFYAFFMSHAEQDLLPLIDPEARGTNERDFALLEELWKRRLVSGGPGTRNLAKLFSLSVRLPAFQARFPKARLLVMARDPVEQIPSTLSLVTGVMDNAFGFWSRPPELRQRVIDRLYAALIELMDRTTADWESGALDRSGVFVVPFHRLMADFEGLMAEILAFVDVETTPELQAEIDKRGASQRAYTSGHRYDLDQFGLSEERIRRDCRAYVATFLPDLLDAYPEA